MWQRFTERARKVVFYAQEEAQKFGEGYVSTEHLLLGLVRESDSVAARVLEALGISHALVRAEVETRLPKGNPHPSNDMTLTPRAKRVIDLAYHEARDLGNNYIGTEHLLLGLVREADGLAGRVLIKLGVELVRARELVRAIQDQNPDSNRQPPKPPRTFAWDEYEDGAKKAILSADAEARRRDHHLVMPFHILLGLLDDPESKACETLRLLDADPEQVRAEVEKRLVWAEGAPDIVLSPHARTVVETAAQEANLLDAKTLGSEHLLLGMAMGGAGEFRQILEEMGITTLRLRDAVKKIGSPDENIPGP